MEGLLFLLIFGVEVAIEIGIRCDVFTASTDCRSR